MDFIKRLRNKASYHLGWTFLLIFFLSADGYAADSPPGVSVTPIIHLFDRSDGESKGCSFAMTLGTHRFGKKYECKNDYAESFWIESPRDGVTFSIHDDPDCANHEAGWQSFRISNPNYGHRTESVSVEAASGKRRGVEITKGIWTVDYQNGRIEGKVSCLWVGGTSG